MLSKGSGYLLYRIVDDAFDYCFPMLRKIGNKLERLEEDIFEGLADEVVRDLSNSKQEIINFRKVIRPQRAVLRDLERTKQRYLAEDLEIYFDDIVDASERIWDMLENFKEVVEALEDTNESVLSHRVNEVLRVLTAFSVVILPLTLFASVFGMNVAFPFEGSVAAFWGILGGMVACWWGWSATSEGAGGCRLRVLVTRRSLLLLAPVAVTLAGCVAERPADPVVLTGADLPRLQGAAPGKVLAFHYLNNAWKQVPVQVDERAVLDLAKPKNAAPVGHTFLTYTDPNTFTGPDPDATLDANDEVAFMGIDSGVKAPAGSAPPGVVAGSGVEVRIVDSLGEPSPSYLYLFRQTGNLDPARGQALRELHASTCSRATTRRPTGWARDRTPRTRRSAPTSTRTTSPIAGRTTPCGSPRRSRAAWTSSTATRTCSRRATACAARTPSPTAPGR